MAGDPGFYVVDTDNHRVLWWDAGAAEGVVVAGVGGEGDALDQLCVPCDCAVDADGGLIVVDCGNGRVLRYEKGSTHGVVIAGGNGEGGALNQLDCPSGVDVSKDGTVFIGDCANHRVVAWPRGAKEGKLVAGGVRGDGMDQLSSPNGVAVGRDGSVYVADFENHRVVRWAPGATEGLLVAGGNGAGSEDGCLDGPCGVSVASNGDVLISERGGQVRNYRITRWCHDASDGVTVAGGNGHGGGLDQLEIPWAIVEAHDGGILVVDSGNHRVVHWLPGATEGVVVAGGAGRGTGLAQLKSPCGRLACMEHQRLALRVLWVLSVLRWTDVAAADGAFRKRPSGLPRNRGGNEIEAGSPAAGLRGWAQQQPQQPQQQRQQPGDEVAQLMAQLEMAQAEVRRLQAQLRGIISANGTLDGMDLRSSDLLAGRVVSSARRLQRLDNVSENSSDEVVYNIVNVSDLHKAHQVVIPDTDFVGGLTQLGSLIPDQASVPLIALLVVMSGLFSGLTMGFTGLDLIGLEIVQRGKSEKLAKCAARIEPVRKSGNLLLCTLILGNVAANSAVAILTSEMASGPMGFVISTAVIVLLAEILPQAIFSSFALQVSAFAVPFVQLLMALTYVVTKPLSMLLDCLLGREVGTVMGSDEIMEMLKLQISLGAVDQAEGEMAKQVAEGALSFRDKGVVETMTPLEDAYMLSTETKLGYNAIREIFETGFSRIPVYGQDKNDYRGLLYTKDLMLADPEDEMKLGDFIAIFHRKTETFFKDTTLASALNAFKKGGTHMGLVRQVVTDDPSRPKLEICGVLTLEDIMEEILQEEIVDETDVYVDVDNHVKVCDGRDAQTLNLAIFNPAWRDSSEGFSSEEVAAIASHLCHAAFGKDSGIELSVPAAEWLVEMCGAQTLTRATAPGVEEIEASDWLYTFGEKTDLCTLVLHGRLGIVGGQEAFRIQAGAFRVLARDALIPGTTFCPDFSAFLVSSQVRLLTISRGRFAEARALDGDKEALRKAIGALKAGAIGGSCMIEACKPCARVGVGDIKDVDAEN